MRELELFEEHKFKKLLRYFNIDQRTMAKNLGISQPHLANMLNGYRPMTEHVEHEIQELLDFRRFQEKKSRKPKPIRKG